jgi:hypothetical protein
MGPVLHRLSLGPRAGALDERPRRVGPGIHVITFTTDRHIPAGGRGHHPGATFVHRAELDPAKKIIEIPARTADEEGDPAHAPVA